MKKDTGKKVGVLGTIAALAASGGMGGRAAASAHPIQAQGQQASQQSNEQPVAAILASGYEFVFDKNGALVTSGIGTYKIADPNGNPPYADPRLPAIALTTDPAPVSSSGSSVQAQSDGSVAPVKMRQLSPEDAAKVTGGSPLVESVYVADTATGSKTGAAAQPTHGGGAPAVVAIDGYNATAASGSTNMVQVGGLTTVHFDLIDGTSYDVGTSIQSAQLSPSELGSSIQPLHFKQKADGTIRPKLGPSQQRASYHQLTKQASRMLDAQAQSTNLAVPQTRRRDSALTRAAVVADAQDRSRQRNLPVDRRSRRG